MNTEDFVQVKKTWKVYEFLDQFFVLVPVDRDQAK